ncbi:hypothetical protein ABPG72_021712 [Tetrahymena utriculariae]
MGCSGSSAMAQEISNIESWKIDNLNIRKLSQDYTVLATGANGFLSSYIIKYLLQLNYKVKGTVKDLADKQKQQYIYDIIPQKYCSKNSFIQADLTSENGWDEAVKDCQYVLHVASPFNYEAKIADAMITSAVKGTQFVLNACVKCSRNIKKVILTSSGKAIFEGNTQKAHFDETNWQNYQNAGFYGNLDKQIFKLIYLSNNQFSGQSKYYAEKEAWKIYEENKDKLNFTVINPTLIRGPSLSTKLSASQGIITNLLNGKLVPQPITLGIVDVGDVAAAHIVAMQEKLSEITKGKRYIICCQSMWIKDIAALLSDYYKQKRPELKINTKELTHEEFEAKVSSVLIYKETLRQSGQYFVMDNANSLQELGMQYVGIYNTIIETAEEILKNGL